MSKVLFITEKVSFISEGIINHLKAQDFEVLTVKPDVTAISNFLKEDKGGEEEVIDPEVAALLSQESEDGNAEAASADGGKKEDIPRIFILYLQGEDNLMIDVLGYIRDMVEDRGIRFFVIGTQEELDTVVGKKADYVAQMYTRPVDLGELIKRLQKEGEAVDKLKEFKSILIVDDDADFLTVMKHWLKNAYKETGVRSGEEALAFLSGEGGVDLILLDYEMPGLNGYEVMARLRDDPLTAGIPLIFLTARNDRESVMRIIRHKPDGYLLKPMKKTELLDTLERFFSESILKQKG